MRGEAAQAEARRDVGTKGRKARQWRFEKSMWRLPAVDGMRWDFYERIRVKGGKDDGGQPRSYSRSHVGGRRWPAWAQEILRGRLILGGRSVATSLNARARPMCPVTLPRFTHNSHSAAPVTHAGSIISATRPHRSFS